MKKILSILICALLFSPWLGADDGGTATVRKHEISVTLGDMLMETLVWPANLHADYSGATTLNPIFTEKRDYGYSPHIALGYEYILNDWLGLGAKGDFQYTGWHNYSYDKHNTQVDRTNGNFCNMCLMASARFTYFRRSSWSLYSSLALGLDINGGTEYNLSGKKTDVGVASDLRLLGMRFDFGRFYASADVGGLYALKNMGTIYMVSSKIVSISFGVKL